MSDGRVPVAPVVLALETATPVCGVAVVTPQGVLAASAFQVGLRHSALLFAEIARLLDAGGLGLRDITHVAVSIGPGSFTGLRIGLSAAKGLCLPSDRPLVPVSTLAALAARVPCARWPVCATIDARKGELYAAVYDTGDGWPELLEVPRAVSPAQLLHERWEKPTVYTGPGVEASELFVEASRGKVAALAPLECRRADAAAVGCLALAGIATNVLPELTGQAMEVLEPEYVRGVDLVRPGGQGAAV